MPHSLDTPRPGTPFSRASALLPRTPSGAAPPSASVSCHQKKRRTSVGSGHARKSLHEGKSPGLPKTPASAVNSMRGCFPGPLPRQGQIEATLMDLAAAVRDAEEAFDTLGHHTAPAREEPRKLLARLRLTSRELASLAACRSSLYSTLAGQTVRAIVEAACNRYLRAHAAPPTGQRIELSFTEDELLDLADAWAGLPLDFEGRMNEARKIHGAARERQAIQSSLSVVRAAKAFIEAAQRDATNPQGRRRLTQREIDLACACDERLRASDEMQLADAMLQEAWERYDKTQAASQHPIGLMLSAADLSQLNQWRDRLLDSFGNDLHQLRLEWRQPAAGIQVMPRDPTARNATQRYALRFDGSQAATTMQLSGLQFWSEFLLESYYLPLPFAVMITP